MLKKHWPILVLVSVSCILLITNFVPDTYLIGWDSTVPEFNLFLNLKRIIFGIWQEYRGLGTLDGMAHTANIMHWLYIALLSIALPQNLIRYVFHLLMHLLGGVGMYYLIKTQILPQLFTHSKKNSLLYSQVPSLLAALFYQLNLMTVQMFYVPFEAFSLHFVALPWMMLTLINYLHQPNSKKLALFSLVNLLTISQAHVPSVFISYIILMSIILVAHFLFHRQFKPIISVVLVMIGLNSFWGIPYLYSAWQKAPEISQSQINQLSTDEIFYRNLEWGDLSSILSFGGFNLDYLDWNQQSSQFQSLMSEWGKTYQLAPYQLITPSLSLISLIGAAICLIKTKKKNYWLSSALVLSLLFFFTQLANDTEGIKIVAQFFREYIPFYHDIFRFTFTKFSLAYLSTLSVFLGIFLYWITNSINRAQLKKYLTITIGLLCSVLIFTISAPAFQSQFFYPGLKQKIPSEYFELIEFFQTQPQNRRIIVLPMPTLYGWTQNDWGYRGSGFIWQALPQSLVDRSFDAWSAANETLYQQLSTAIESQDLELFKNTLLKYQISYALIDRSIYVPNKTDDFYKLTEVESYLEQLDGNKIWEHGSLLVYDLSSMVGVQDQIFVPTKLAQVNPTDTSYLRFDPIYAQLQNYIENSDYDIVFPLSDLTRQRAIETSINENKIVFSKNKNEKLNETIIPAAEELNSISPVAKVSYLEDQLQIDFEPLVWINSQAVGELPTQKIDLNGSPDKLVIQFEATVFEIDKGESAVVQIGPLQTQDQLLIAYFDQELADYENNSIIIDEENLKQEILFESFKDNLAMPESISINDQEWIEVSVPTVDQDIWPDYQSTIAENCEYFKQGAVNKKIMNEQIIYAAKDGAALCDKLVIPNSSTLESSLVHIKGENLAGRNLKIIVENPATDQEEIVNLVGDTNFSQIFPLLSWPNLQAENYVINLESKSFGRQASKNLIEKISLARLTTDSKWLSQIYFSSSDQENIFTNHENNSIEQVEKIGTVFYKFKTNFSQEGIFILNQSFDQGWAAISNNKTLEHYRADGWANAWKIPAGEYEIIIIYWPQLLVFTGYIFLIVTIIFLATRAFHSKSKK